MRAAREVAQLGDDRTRIDRAAGDGLDDIASFGQAAVRSSTAMMSARSSAAASVSRMSFLNAPTRSRCTPGLSHRPSTRGAVDSVAQEIMSAFATVPSRSVHGCAGMPARAQAAAVASACAAVRLQMLTRSSGRIERCASISARPIRPAPTTRSARASRRARRDAAYADAPAVRRAVSSSPSRRASSTPSRASKSA